MSSDQEHFIHNRAVHTARERMGERLFSMPWAINVLGDFDTAEIKIIARNLSRSIEYFTEIEPYSIFPSETLITKLALIYG